MSRWIEEVVWWHVYPLGFVGSERDARVCGGIEHCFGKLAAWLDYAADFGVSGILVRADLCLV